VHKLHVSKLFTDSAGIWKSCADDCMLLPLPAYNIYKNVIIQQMKLRQ